MSYQFGRTFTRMVILSMVFMSWGMTQATASAQSAITSNDLTITLGDGWQTKAKLSYPANATGPLPTVILVHGSGPNDLDHTIIPPGASRPLSSNFRTIAEHFAAQGIAVLRYNKRYVSGPDQFDAAKFGALSLDDFLSDLERVLAVAKQNKHVDPQNIFVYSWSEGSLMGAALAEKHPELRGAIFQGAISSTRPEIFIEDYTAVVLPYVLSYSTDGKISADTLKNAIEGNGGMFARLVAYDFSDPSVTDTIKVNPFFDGNSDGILDPETEIRPLLPAWVDKALAPGGVIAIYRGYPGVADRAANIAMPVFMLQGETDSSTRANHADELRKAFAANKDFTLKLYPGLGHSLGSASSMIDDNFRPIENAPMDDTVAWINTHSLVKPAALPHTGATELPLVLIMALLAAGISVVALIMRRSEERAVRGKE